MPVYGHIALAFLGALGVYLLFLALTGSLEFLVRKPVEMIPGDLEAKARQNPVVAMTNHAMVDLSRMLQPAAQDLPQRLRQSGYFYPSVEVFYLRRLLFAIFWGIAVFFLLSLVGVSWIPSILATCGAAYFGFFEPNRRVAAALKTRTQRMMREMGYAMELIVMANKVNAPLEDALASVGDFGLFGRLCREIVRHRGLGQELKVAIDKAQMDFPVFPELLEFFDLIRTKGSGAPIDRALQVQAESFRNKMILEIIRIAASVESRVSFLASSLGAMSAMLPILGAMLMTMF